MTEHNDIDEGWIATITHGRYLVHGDAGEGAPLLVGCHGYGENADRHMKELRRIEGADGWLLCAVGALHPFYNNKTGEVIDSWMTRRGRGQAIVDNISYVSRVVAEVRRRYKPSDRLVFAGFSQGVAMAYRATVASGHPCHGLIALAGDVPPDVAAREGSLPPVLLGRGTEDAWYTEAKMGSDLATLEQLGTDVETCVFDAGHVWTPEFYASAGAFLSRVDAR